jgi:hypothetical protein
MRAVWSGIPTWPTKEDVARSRRRSKGVMRDRSSACAKMCARPFWSAHVSSYVFGLRVSKGRTNLCAIALDHFPVPNPAPRQVCVRAEPRNYGRKRLGRIARNAGERRAGDGLSRLAPARTAHSRKRAPSPRRSLPGRGRGERGLTDSHALCITWELLPPVGMFLEVGLSDGHV